MPVRRRKAWRNQPIQRIRDLAITLRSGIQRSARARGAHARHQVRERGACLSGERVAGVPQIVEVHTRQAGGGHRRARTLSDRRDVLETDIGGIPLAYGESRP